MGGGRGPHSRVLNDVVHEGDDGGALGGGVLVSEPAGAVFRHDELRGAWGPVRPRLLEPFFSGSHRKGLLKSPQGLALYCGRQQELALTGALGPSGPRRARPTLAHLTASLQLSSRAAPLQPLLSKPWAPSDVLEGCLGGDRGSWAPGTRGCLPGNYSRVRPLASTCFTSWGARGDASKGQGVPRLWGAQRGRVWGQALTCSVLSNQRLPLLSLLPPPCSICPATWLRYLSSETRGMTPSRHTVKMLFWMERTESRFTLSAGGTVGRGPKWGVRPAAAYDASRTFAERWEQLQGVTLNRALQPHSTRKAPQHPAHLRNEGVEDQGLTESWGGSQGPHTGVWLGDSAPG